ncbi:zinc ribbon domain-containing protein [Natrinema caseinilyticum]|uniref:zinc ribbon domain-containing protein n=1 Tax=Natrinema caseinilyticum TaxID=2961570 RepID=UPI0020C3C02B|nr:zinc ribbon domain-containing protein [Natrinema caseinilyticum]
MSDRDDGAGSDDASLDGNAGDAGASTDGELSTSSSTSTSSSSSDTQIFVDDFDRYGSEETPVETCPRCERDLPSDGVYNFCPFCGGEL